MDLAELAELVKQKVERCQKLQHRLVDVEAEKKVKELLLRYCTLEKQSIVLISLLQLPQDHAHRHQLGVHKWRSGR